MGFFSNILGGLKKAARSRFEINKDSNTIQFLINSEDDQYFTLSFDNMLVENSYDPCIIDAFIIKGSNSSIGELYIETIRLEPKCEWNISAGSAFEIFIKREFNNYDLEQIKSFDDDFCKFTKYKIDDEKEVGIIWFCLNDTELFIFDKKGKLFNDLLEIYNVKNKDIYISDLEEFNIEFKKSVASSNIIDGFFSQDS